MSNRCTFAEGRARAHQHNWKLSAQVCCLVLTILSCFFSFEFIFLSATTPLECIWSEKRACCVGEEWNRNGIASCKHGSVQSHRFTVPIVLTLVLQYAMYDSSRLSFHLGELPSGHVRLQTSQMYEMSVSARVPKIVAHQREKVIVHCLPLPHVLSVWWKEEYHM